MTVLFGSPTSRLRATALGVLGASAILAGPARGQGTRLGLQAIRLEIERPGEHQRDRQAQERDQDEHPQHPRRRIEGRERDAGHLHHQPRHHHVGRSDLEDLAALEFGEQVHGVPLPARSSPHSKSVSPSGLHPAGQPFSRQ